MNITVIECNDSQLTLTQRDANGEQHCVSEPGFAYVEHHEIIFGEPARLQAQLNPAAVYSHYWQRLGYQDIVSDHPQVRHYADLVYLQLQHLLSLVEPCEEVVLVVPPSFSAAQLSLLLGIMQSCQLKVLAMVNSVVLVMSSRQSTGQQIWLDIGLHHSECSRLNSGEKIIFDRVDTYSEQGIYSLICHLARWLNQLFISQCRFDTSLAADSEQSIYSQLSNILAKSTSSYRISIGDREITIKRQQLNQQIDIFFNDLIAAVQRFSDHSGNKVAISARFATLLSGTRCADLLAPVPAALTYGQVLNQLNNISQLATAERKTSISLITELPLAAVPPVTSASTISHIVFNGQAYPLTCQTLFLSDIENQALRVINDGCNVAEIKKVGLQWQLSCLNDHKVVLGQSVIAQSRVLSCGDEITLGQSNSSFTLINVHQEL